MKKYFLELGLFFQKEKTQIGCIKEGFEFLGYSFGKNGRKVPQTAKEHLESSMEKMWFEKMEKSLEERLKKVLEIRMGWEQYYKGENEIDDIFTFSAIIYDGSKKGKKITNQLERQRKKLHNDFRDVCFFLASYWRSEKRDTMSLFEYEDYYGFIVSEDSQIEIAEEFLREILDYYEKLEMEETEELFVELIQLYMDVGRYQTADRIDTFLRKSFFKGQEKGTSDFKAPVQATIQNAVTIKDINLFMNLFCGREDMFAEEREVQGHRKYEVVAQPLTKMEVRSHIAGKRTIGSYVQRSNATAHFLVLDIDISKRVLLECCDGRGDFSKYYRKTGEYAKNVLSILRKMGLKGYPEESGYRGYHVWLFFDSWLSVRYINFLSDCIAANLPEEEDIHVEFFPNKTHLRPGKAGQLIKLPYGLHGQTGRQGYLCGEDLSAVEDIDAFMQGIVLYSLNEVKRIISRASGVRQEKAHAGHMEIDFSDLSGLDTGIIAVLEKCNLMRYLYYKAKKPVI